MEKQTVMTLQCFSASLCLCLAKLQPPLILRTQLPFLKTGASVLFRSFGRAEVMQVKNICSGNLGKSCKFLIKFRATGNNLQLLSIQVFMQQALAKRSSVGLMKFTKLYVIVNPYSRKMYTVSDQDIQNVVFMNCFDVSLSFLIAKSSSGRRLPFGWGRVQDVSSSGALSLGRRTRSDRWSSRQRTMSRSWGVLRPSWLPSSYQWSPTRISRSGSSSGTAAASSFPGHSGECMSRLSLGGCHRSSNLSAPAVASGIAQAVATSYHHMGLSKSRGRRNTLHHRKDFFCFPPKNLWWA